RRGRLRPVCVGLRRRPPRRRDRSQPWGGCAVTVSVGPRPYFLINELDNVGNDGPNVTFCHPGLKATLRQCANTLTTFRFCPSNFVLGHCGAALQFLERTDRGHDVALRMGAGAAECDINLTKDKKLVCCHKRCNLHETTDVLARPRLVAKYSRPFRPVGPTPRASAKCCTTDFTLHEIQNEMYGRMSSRNRQAKTVEEYLSRPPELQTGLYLHDCPHSHADFVQVVNASGGNFVPEFKSLNGTVLSKLGLTREEFVQMVLDGYENMTDAERVCLQLFTWEDLYYLTNRTCYGKHVCPGQEPLSDVVRSTPASKELCTARRLWRLGNRAGHTHAAGARRAWGRRPYQLRLGGVGGKVGDFGVDPRAIPRDVRVLIEQSRLAGTLQTDADLLKVIYVLYKDVSVEAIFTDWPSVVSFYANCKGIRLR
ncbi:LOW QUALITY PROTEIN: hypothetical protein ACHAWF_007582, partial [Thalassiosira exigua]